MSGGLAWSAVATLVLSGPPEALRARAVLAQQGLTQEVTEDDFGPEHMVEFLLDDAYVALSTISAAALCNPIVVDEQYRALDREYWRLWKQAQALMGREPRLRDIRLFHCHSKRDLSYEQAIRLKQRASRALKKVAALLRRGRLD